MYKRQQEAATVREYTRYAVAYNGDDITHGIVVPAGSTVMTGLPYLKIFDSKELAEEKFGNIFTEDKDEILPE